ncbi:MAG TPA: glycosyltransferase family 2 protein [Thermoplasmata archaeon]|nr:glycosyltransferase family 2 protein [Thermoplasmata archaeon]HTT34960.1 glycosyltransferase family 2 protein [Thermoplasmata archaeon]
MVDAVEVSVVIGAFRRSAHLPAAVRSVRDQTLGRDRFEIVVTKSFADPSVDAALAADGVRVIQDDEPVIGRWLLRAVRAGRGPIVAFLDDDDEFEPDRLARIVETFRAHPDLGFYRNRVRVIDGDGRAVPPERWRRHEVDAARDASGPMYRAAHDKRGLWRTGARDGWATFNSSTMAIRRELLDGAVGAAFERTMQPDQFLFLAGLVAPFGVFLDDRRLTRYRYYGGNVSHTLERLHDWAGSEHEMADVARRGGEPEYAEFLAREADHYEQMYRGGRLMQRIGEGADRREVMRLTEEYFRFLGAHPAERRWTVDAWAAGLYGLGCVVAPSLTRPIARARTSARAAAEGRPDPFRGPA